MIFKVKATKQVEAQSVGVAVKQPRRQTYGRLAYYFPQYTLKDLDAMSVRDLNLLINTIAQIQKEEDVRFNNIIVKAMGGNKKGR